MSRADARGLKSLIFVYHALKPLLACNKTLLVTITLVGHKCSPSWVELSLLIPLLSCKA